MKIKVVVLIALIVVFGAAIVIRTAPKSQQQLTSQEIRQLEKKEKQARLSLKEAAQLAKARGQQRVVAPSLSTLYLGTVGTSSDLDKKLSEYTVVIAKLIEKKSYMYGNAAVGTWNKFKVVETLNQAPPRPVPFPWPAIPEELFPIKEDEFLVHTWGGTVTIDGVEVAQADADVPVFNKPGKYLLAVSLDPSTNIGWLEIGPQSLLPVNDDDTLDMGNDKYLLQQVIKDHHSGSVKQLKDKLKNRRFVSQ